MRSSLASLSVRSSVSPSPHPLLASGHISCIVATYDHRRLNLTNGSVAGPYGLRLTWLSMHGYIRPTHLSLVTQE